jgi:hypothetical protein
MEERIPMTAVGRESIDDDLFSASAIDDPYTYLGRLREADPVHWNEIHRVWIVTRWNRRRRVASSVQVQYRH